MVNSLHETTGRTVGTLHYPQLSEGQPSHGPCHTMNLLSTTPAVVALSIQEGDRGSHVSLSLPKVEQHCKLVMQLADALQSSREMERTSWMMSSLNATSKIQHLLSTKQFDAATSHLEESTWQGHQLIVSLMTRFSNALLPVVLLLVPTCHRVSETVATDDANEDE